MVPALAVMYPPDAAASDPQALLAMKLAQHVRNTTPDPPWNRFVPYNGAFGSEQLTWLRDELRSAERARERVLVLSHVVSG